MTFNFSEKTIFTGFTSVEQASIIAAMQTAYNGSSTAKVMFDTWMDAGNIINIKYVPGVFQALTNMNPVTGIYDIPVGKLKIDLSYIENLYYIDSLGTAVKHSLVGAIVHELGHTLTGRRDYHNSTLPLPDIASGDFMGDNVKFVNTIWQELGLDREISYVAQAWELGKVPKNAKDAIGWDLFKADYKYTNGVNINGAVVGDRNIGTGATNDLLIGGPTGNILQSGDGNDFLFGAGGNDTLKGGASRDTAVYFGSPLDYDIRQNQNGSWAVKNLRGAKDAGSDTLENVEVVQFDGGKTYELKKNGLTFQTDFALVIDTTGSMGNSINSVKVQASALIDAVFAGGNNDGRIGVVGFKDTINGEPSQVILPFTEQDDFAARKAAAIKAIDSITVSGGGDIPETDFDGLRLALNGSMGQWRAGAGVRRIALFTDAPVKDGALAAEVTALAKSIGATITKSSSLVGTGGSVETFSLSSGGGSLGLNSPGDPNASINIPFVLSDEPIAPDLTTTQVQIFTIFTGTPGTDTAALSAIASDNAGAFLNAPTNDDLVKTLLKIISAPTISVVANDANAAETKTGETVNPGQFTLTRTGDMTQALTVAYTLAGTASSADYQTIPGTVTFAAGKDTATINLNVIDDNIYENTETVVLTITPNAAYALTATNSATINIADNDVLPVITLAKGVDAAEPTTVGSFSLTRTGDVTAALTVNLDVPTGTATSGTDYTALATTATFAAGSATATVNVTPIDDTLVEGTETIALAVKTGTGYTLGANATASINLIDNDVAPVVLPSVTISKGTDAAEPATAGSFTLTRTGDTTAALTVNLDVPTGTATSGTDYTALATTVTFAAGSATATINVTPIDDTIVEPIETVGLVLKAGAGYTLGAVPTASINLVDNDVAPVVLPVVSILKGTDAAEPAIAGSFTITRTGDTTTALTVNLDTPTGSATNGVDYTTLPTTVVFAAGSATATVIITPIDDTIVEPTETVGLVLKAGTGYTLGIIPVGVTSRL